MKLILNSLQKQPNLADTRQGWQRNALLATLAGQVLEFNIA